jgi:hypothetical protein
VIVVDELLPANLNSEFGRVMVSEAQHAGAVIVAIGSLGLRAHSDAEWHPVLQDQSRGGNSKVKKARN